MLNKDTRGKCQFPLFTDLTGRVFLHQNIADTDDRLLVKVFSLCKKAKIVSAHQVNNRPNYNKVKCIL